MRFYKFVLFFVLLVELCSTKENPIGFLNYENNHKGFLYYNDSHPLKEKNKKDCENDEKTSGVAKLKDFQKGMEEAQSNWVMKGDIESAIEFNKYLQKSSHMGNKAAKNLNFVQKVIDRNHEEDLKNHGPEGEKGPAGRVVSQYLERKQKEELIDFFAKNFVVAFFTSKDCIVCDFQQKVVSRLKYDHNIKISVFSLEGGMYFGQKSEVLTEKTKNMLDLKGVPTIICYDLRGNDPAEAFRVSGVVPDDEFFDIVKMYLSDSKDKK